MKVLFNDTFVEEQSASYRLNRAFRFGDACFETIRIYNGRPLYWSDHQQRLIKTLHVLSMQIPAEFTDVRFFEMIVELCRLNNIGKSGRVRLTVYRDGAGLYRPENNKVQYVGEASALSDDSYSLNNKGLSVSFYNEIQKPHYIFSSLKTTNCLLQIVAAEHCAKAGLDDYILLNSSGDVAEAISSNVFVYKDNMFFTPAQDEGCIPGIMRLQLMQILAEEGIFVLEGCVTKQMVLEAEEVFVTNVIRGVQWVKSCGKSTYKNNIALELVGRINQLIQ